MYVQNKYMRRKYNLQVEDHGDMTDHAKTHALEQANSVLNRKKPRLWVYVVMDLAIVALIATALVSVFIAIARK